MLDRCHSLLSPSKETVKEAVQLEDYEEGGLITVSALREALESVGIEGVDQEVIDFIVYYVYSRGGEDVGAVKY
jgi:Ca2+-binding EF-hand superfamily protein